MYSYFPWIYLVLWARNFSACAGRERTSGHYRQVFVENTRCWRHQSDHRTFNNCVVSACCGLSCFSHRVNCKNDRILSFCIVLWAIPNLCSVAQVSACRGRDWRLRTTLLCEPLLDELCIKHVIYCIHHNHPTNLRWLHAVIITIH